MNTHPSPLHYTRQARPPAPLSPPLAKKEAKYSTMQECNFSVQALVDMCAKRDHAESNHNHKDKPATQTVDIRNDLPCTSVIAIARECLTWKWVSAVNIRCDEQFQFEQLTQSDNYVERIRQASFREGKWNAIKSGYQKAYVSISLVPSLGSTDQSPVNFL